MDNFRVFFGYNIYMLTKRQNQIHKFIDEYVGHHEVSPTIQEIANRFHLSVSTIHEHLQAIERKGYLKKDHGQARAMETQDPNEGLVWIPLLGTIAAGQPIEAINTNETIAVSKNKLHPGNIYALQVFGDSMIDENINNGDIVLVREQSTAENGQKVVALLDNYAATLKKFYKEKGHIRLQPANKNIEPIIIRNGKDVAIQGIVVDIIKNYRDYSLPSYIPKEISTRIEPDEKLPLNKIICNDALEELKKLPKESCDTIIIDPPYNIGKDFGNNTDDRELDEYVRWCKDWINESIRILKPTGTMFIYGFSEILAYLSVEIPINKRWLIWHYTNKNVASLNFWQRSHESIICAWKNKPVFNRDEVREPYTEGFLNGSAGKIRKGTIGRFSKGGQETVYNAHQGGALPRDVIKIPALAGGAGRVERWFLCKTCDDVFEPNKLKKHLGHNILKHPTQKPFELTRKLIKSTMPKNNGVVLVPFIGSGSECAVAKELGQSYIGFEINPDYVKLAEGMIAKTRTVSRLF